MSKRKLTVLFSLLAVGSLLLAACGAPATEPSTAAEGITFGLVLVGPQNDHGWSQAHYEGGQYVVDNMPGAEMIVFE